MSSDPGTIEAVIEDSVLTAFVSGSNFQVLSYSLKKWRNRLNVLPLLIDRRR